VTAVLKQISQVVSELSIEISKEDVQGALNKAYSRLSKTAKVRGFRKGKAPRGVLRQMYGAAVLNELRGDLVSEHLMKAFQENDLNPISQPEIDAQDFKENEAYKFKVKFELKPEIEKVEYNDIELERYRTSIEKEDVATELKRLQTSTASLIDLKKPRAAKTGDMAKIEMKRWEDGEWKVAELPEQEVAIGDGQSMKEIEDALVGMNVDEEKVIDFGSGEELEEDRKRFMLKLVGLKGRKLAKLDDEFAKDLGDFETLEQLREDIEKRIKEGRERAEDQRLKGKMFEALRGKNAMDLPPSLVQRQAHAMQMQLMGMMNQNQQPDDEVFKKLSEGAEASAKEMVHQHLLLLEVARHEKIEVTDEEVDSTIAERAEMAGIPVPMLKAEFGKEGRLDELKTQMLETKIFDFVSTKVKIKEIDSPKEEDQADDTNK
jgi:trigger factor